MSVVSLRLNEEEEKLFKGYSQQTGKTLSELFKTALAEEIETELDYEIGVQALEAYRQDPVSSSIGEFIKELENDL
ncbi:translation repressor RelB [Aerococcus urinaehominis]|uniref:Translation repressor RelB n=1 Tax=Aerococcus urinaehominis TaxID=128944 RepID=A0A120IB32_9LACT|nr:DUF6290 family protein [Aerococcus urinaehominis]AMB99968.1 translation repressor RelB [Aerococcus urinaehominis]SDM44931.1 hypothetical protein SAMN04487985_11717 [Aerococcus urinaehominis]